MDEVAQDMNSFMKVIDTHNLVTPGSWHMLKNKNSQPGRLLSFTVIENLKFGFKLPKDFHRNSKNVPFKP